LPRILVISFQTKSKVTLSDTIFDEEYQLFGMCKHIGSLRGGHYISYVKHRDVWYYKDDDIVEEKQPNLTDTYYMALYYRNKNSEI